MHRRHAVRAEALDHQPEGQRQHRIAGGGAQR